MSWNEIAKALTILLGAALTVVVMVVLIAWGVAAVAS